MYGIWKILNRMGDIVSGDGTWTMDHGPWKE